MIHHFLGVHPSVQAAERRQDETHGEAVGGRRVNDQAPQAAKRLRLSSPVRFEELAGSHPRLLALHFQAAQDRANKIHPHETPVFSLSRQPAANTQ